MATADQQHRDFLEKYRRERLNAYRSTPDRINADYSDEGQNQSGYHKRFAFELIQNADDAMQDELDEKKVRFEVNDGVLLVANTGRPINKGDVTSLCVMSSTTKGADGEKRASIGHKGRGFSSVLEITEKPQIFSSGISFEFHREKSREKLKEVVESIGGTSVDGISSWEDIDGVPLMGLPFPPEETPARVQELIESGYNTVFRFNLKDDVVDDVVETLTSLDRNTVLFLQELEELEIDIGSETESWVIERESKSIESPSTDLQFVTVRHLSGGSETGSDVFALFSRFDIEIGENTGGIDENTWGDVNYTQIGLALRVEERDDGIHLAKLSEKPYFHVFLPTEERCPIPVLVNGAFHTAISRTTIKVTADEDNYNGFLLQQIANLLATDVRAYAEETATTIEEFIECLDFTQLSLESLEAGSLDGRFIEAVQSEFADVPFIPRLEKLATGEMLSNPGVKSVSEVVVPYYAAEKPEIAEATARIYGNERLEVEGLETQGWFPKTSLLTPERAAILEGLGSTVLQPEEVPLVLGSVSNEDTPLITPESERELAIDPILQVLIWIWKTISGQEDVVERFKDAANSSAVFPVGKPNGKVVRHVAKTDDTEFFLPPRRELPDIELSGIRFLTPPVYRPSGSVDSQTQSELVEGLKPGLEAIWDVSEFDFEEVVQAAVFPKVRSPQNADWDDSELRDMQVLDLIRRLGHRSIDPDSPLPFVERDGTLHRLCLLPVPTRKGDWEPAYRVYFGKEWQPALPNTARVERLLQAAEVEKVPYLADPTDLPGDVQPEKDSEDDANEESEFEAWKQFFQWLGVAQHIRLEPLFDPTEQRQLTATNGMQRPEKGSILARLEEEDWEEYRRHLLDALDNSGRKRREYDSIYQLQGIEYFNQFLEHAYRKEEVAELFFEHLVYWWQHDLRDFTHPILATSDQRTWTRRNQNSPTENEERRVGLNLWLWQLKHASWCPSNQGMVKPEDVWLPSESVRTRFEVHDLILLPVLSESVLEPASDVRDLLHTLGVRHEVSRSSFRPEDAEIIASTIAEMFSDKDDDVISGSLRQIKPVYRYLSELLPGLDQSRTVSDEEWAVAQEELREIEVLSRRGESDFVFEPAHRTYFVRSPDVLDRIPVEGVPIFALEEDEAVRFGTYFDLRDLEDEAEAEPHYLDEDEDKTESVAAFLEEMAPFILCRLEAERPSQELIEEDINGMRAFLENLTIVDEIEVTYQFGDGEDATEIPSEPDFFLDRRGRKRNEPVLPFVRSSPTQEGQNRLLARALCEYLEVSQFEGVITLMNAETDEQRLQYLKLAGAPSSRADVEGKRRDLKEDGSSSTDIDFEFEEKSGVEGLEEASTQDNTSVEEELKRREQRETRNYPVYDPDELKIQGDSITITTKPEEQDSGGGSEGSGDSSREEGTGTTVSQDYRSKVDALGMSITLQYERNRVEEEYDCEQPDEYVFDIHNEDRIEEVKEDRVAGPVLDRLEEQGLPLPFPGFDILTVNPVTGEADRLIELKSSGHDTRTPPVTWNEWKTASKTEVQDRFYLYIVGNLRKDIRSDPYLREIPNPFGILNSETRERREVKKEVKVDITSFRKQAEITETPLSVESSKEE